MCCGDGTVLDLPPEAIEAVAGYRRLLAERGFDWGDERVDLFRMARFRLLADVYLAYAGSGDWSAAIRAQVADGVPAGTVLVRDGVATAGPALLTFPGHAVAIDVVTDDGEEARVETVDVAGPFEMAGVRVEDAVRVVPAARLRLRSPRCARWSVVDEAGGAWFPDGEPRKWDVHGDPFFHAQDVTLDVPAAPLRVVCARGLEFGTVERAITPDGTAELELDPPRLHDPAARGWYGGDLHVHQNYSGDEVVTAAQARRMQHGEGLHLMNLTAGNLATSLVYDREQLEGTAGRDLWADPDGVARMGVEYRNDLLGHVVGLGPSAAPNRWYAGHPRSDHAEHWPPNAVACAELRDLGATVTYPHPAVTDLSDPAAFTAAPGAPEARELVADAALGLVDSIDVISPFHHEGAIVLYHHLLNCGLRLAATAGTDTFLSFARLGTASNPPGWGRVYARLGAEPLSVRAFQDAIRAGRTVVTNGPWIELEVDGEGPGAVLRRSPGDTLRVVARVAGPGAERLTLAGPDGVLAETAGSELRATVEVGGPLWVAAIARGEGHPHTLDTSVLAHTSPVHVEVAGARATRPASAAWCLAVLDGLDHLVREHGTFHTPEHLDEVVEVLDRARGFYRQIATPRA